MRSFSFIFLTFFLMIFSCTSNHNKTDGQKKVFTGAAGEIRLTVLAPGHFHANLLQKNNLPEVNDSVFVYSATNDTGLEQYISAIESFNHREEAPTNWKTIVYCDSDFLDKMVTDRQGNVVILAGNNKEKTEYIYSAVAAGFNILSDKPMAINQADFHLLEKIYAKADSQNVLLYDMMTERYDILNIIEKELINDRKFFGELQLGTSEEPSVYMESVHHFYKEVSGKTLIRPAWYYDVEQQGEGIADVTTHLIDILFWKCFPNQSIDYMRDISTITATHWPTEITLEQFTQSTRESIFPDYLQKDIINSTLNVFANGTINFNLKNHHIGLKVIWNWQAPEGSGDTFIATIKGTNAILKTVQNKEQNFTKQLFVQKPEGIDELVFSANLQKVVEKIQTSYPFVSVSPTANIGEYLIDIPIENRDGHESHFKYVATSFFNFLVNRNMPEWEKNNTLAKYYITTKAVEVAKVRDSLH